MSIDGRYTGRTVTPGANARSVAVAGDLRTVVATSPARTVTPAV